MKLLCVFILMITSSLATTSTQSDADEKQLLRMEHAWNNALKTRNVRWFEDNLAEDLTDIGSADGVLRTKSEDIAEIKTDETFYESLELSDLKVRVEGKVGIVTGINHLKGRGEQGRELDVALAFTDTYIKRDGRWQVWASQHTRMAKPRRSKP